MTQDQKDFFNKVIKQKLIEMAIDGSLPSDMTELQDSHFEEEAEAYNNSDEVERRVRIEHLSHYISSDDLDGALRLLENEDDDSIPADYIVTMWKPLEDRFTVSELLDLI
jgi:type I site-specific restriction-modification system R (restriction) subunit